MIPKPLLFFSTVALAVLTPAIAGDNWDNPDFLRLHDYGKTVTLNRTIVVGPGKVFDGVLPNGKWTRYIAQKRMGDGSQKENQRPLFLLRPGATLQHVIIDQPAADGIHVEAADNRKTVVRNVEFRDVGEDAITVVSGDNGADVLIDNCFFRRATDKVIQVNSSAKVLIDNCVAIKFGIFARSSGTGSNKKYRITVDDLLARDGKVILRMTNSKARGLVSDCNLFEIDKTISTSNGAKIEVKNCKKDEEGGFFKWYFD